MIVVVMNKGAGTGGDVSAEVRSAFEHAGASVSVVLTDSAGISTAIRKAVLDGATTIVAAGGDGTVNAVASAIVNTPIRLGVIPLGTLNHFAKDAGIPLELEEAVRTIVQGAVKSTDAGSVNDRVFINNSSIGLYPFMVRDREKQRFKFKRSKMWALILACINTFKRYPIMSVRLTIDGETRRYKTPEVFVGNNAYQLEAFSVKRRTVLNAGELCLIAVKSLSPWRTIFLAIIVQFFRRPASILFEIASTPELWLDIDQVNVPVSLDGEVVMLATPLHYRSMKHSLQLILPVQA